MAGFFFSIVLFIVGFLSMCQHAEPMIIFGSFISSGLFYVGMQIWQIVYYIEKRDKQLHEHAAQLFGSEEV